MRLVSTDPDEPGFFAFGQVAVGVIAFGQLALGIVAIGQLARGIVCVGQGAVGVLAVGQGAIGLWHGTGMLAIAGRSGYGLSLHLLPHVVREPEPSLPVAIPLEALVDGRTREGWVACLLARAGALEGDASRIDVSRIASRLAAGAGDGCDRAHVKTSASVVGEASGYRDASAHVELVAEDVILHRSRPRSHLAYATAPLGKIGASASTGAIVARSVGWLIAAAVVAALSIGPLLEALLRR